MNRTKVYYLNVVLLSCRCITMQSLPCSFTALPRCREWRHHGDNVISCPSPHIIARGSLNEHRAASLQQLGAPDATSCLCVRRPSRAPERGRTVPPAVRATLASADAPCLQPLTLPLPPQPQPPHRSAVLVRGATEPTITAVGLTDQAWTER